ncbi:hypothetical protein GDO78_022573 [Eleutherodactylus coqui]|uniref:Uncharacterized protein n=1 Tax=Eleutherodactylus coqui TaxID=57060 RepID=A0A8J6BMJ0_ELECQ|nr:hypothetical protein GDO78_022573 [Eleutherodactylus coqui]
MRGKHPEIVCLYLVISSFWRRLRLICPVIVTRHVKRSDSDLQECCLPIGSTVEALHHCSICLLPVTYYLLPLGEYIWPEPLYS